MRRGRNAINQLNTRFSRESGFEVRHSGAAKYDGPGACICGLGNGSGHLLFHFSAACFNLEHRETRGKDACTGVIIAIVSDISGDHRNRNRERRHNSERIGM